MIKKYRIFVCIIIAFSILVSTLLYYANINAEKKCQTIKQIALIKIALEIFRKNNGKYPTTTESLDSIIKYLNNRKDIIDPWNNKYMYVYPGYYNKNKYDIYSLGPDNKSSTNGNDFDDINDWSNEECSSFEWDKFILFYSIGTVILIIIYIVATQFTKLRYRNLTK